MKKKLEMHLLNDEQLDGVVGGLKPSNPCRQKGDVIEECSVLLGYTNIYLCAFYEASCSKYFKYACGMGDMECSPNFTLKPTNPRSL